MKLTSLLLVVSTLVLSNQSFAADAAAGPVKEFDVRGVSVEILRSREVGEPSKDLPIYHVLVGKDAQGNAVNMGFFEKHYAGKLEQSRLLNLCLRRMESMNHRDRLNIGGKGRMIRENNVERLDVIKLTHCTLVKAQ